VNKCGNLFVIVVFHSVADRSFAVQEPVDIGNYLGLRDFGAAVEIPSKQVTGIG
jgi:hypothetical protein